MNASTRIVTACNRSMSKLLARSGLCVPSPRHLEQVQISELTADSREVKPGSCFVAIRGLRSDGHKYVRGAVEAGAVAVVVEDDVEVPQGVALIRVPDSRAALAKLAAAFYGLAPHSDCPLRLVGVTGTNGKTTVAWMIRSILRAAGSKTALLGTVEYDLIAERLRAPLTTPDALDLCRHLSVAVRAGGTYGVLEVSSHAMNQKRCDGLRFEAGVFTNLSGDHLDYHETETAYLQSKRRLFTGLDEHAVAIVNADDPNCDALVSATSARVVRFGLESKGVDIGAVISEMGRRGSRFRLRGLGDDVEIRTSLIGHYNVSNILAAAATASALGVTSQDIRAGIEAMSGVPGRLERVEPDGCPFAVLVDYAHTDDALENVLRVLRPLTEGRLICVFGCGGDRDRTKRPRMASAAARWADLAYVTSDNPRSEDPRAIIDDVLAGFSSRCECGVEAIVERAGAIAAAIEVARPGDVVLIAGKGHEDYQIVGEEVLSFDDREVARACLRDAAKATEGAAA